MLGSRITGKPEVIPKDEVRHNKIKSVQQEKIISVQQKKLREQHGHTVRETSAVLGGSCQAPESRRWRSDSCKGSVSHAQGAAARSRLSPAGSKGLAHPEPPGRCNGREHGLVRLLLAVLRGLPQRAFRNAMVPLPEQSLSLHAGSWTVPRQLMVRAPKARNAVTKLPHGTSLLDLRSSLPVAADRQVVDGLQVFSPESALIDCSPNFFSHNSTDVRAVLLMVRDASGLLARLLAGGHTIIAGRLAGAFRNIGRDRIADDIVKTMTAAGYAVRENDPFTDRPNLVLRTRETSPYVNRIRLLWQKMREPIIERFPKAPGTPRNIAAYLKRVNETYVTDAYHSLSIEGYRVTADLIERVRAGSWNPETNEGDREQRNAMAARGYWLAFQSVQEGVGTSSAWR
jgi:hypothetical protein